MEKDKNKIITKIILITNTSLAILMGVLFLIQICRIYFGAKPNEVMFTRELSLKYIKQILFIVILWIIGIIVGFIYSLYHTISLKNNVYPSNFTKLKNLERIMQDEDINEIELKDEYAYLKNETKKRKIVWWINIGVLCVCCICSLIYICNINNFRYTDGVNPTKQVTSMVLYLLPWIILSFSSLLLCKIYEERSSKNSLEIIKKVIKIKGKKEYIYKENKQKKMAMNITSIVIGVVAVIFIIVGALNGGAESVMQKAINICTECIGLG